MFAIDNTYPDMTIYLDIDEQAGLDRLVDREFKDRLDQESIDFHHASPMMATISVLREKYDLHMTAERYVSAETPETENRFIRE